MYKMFYIMLIVVLWEPTCYVWYLSWQIRLEWQGKFNGLASLYSSELKELVLFYLKLKMTLTDLAWHWTKPVCMVSQSGHHWLGPDLQLYSAVQCSITNMKPFTQQTSYVLRAGYQHFHNSCPTKSAVPSSLTVHCPLHWAVLYTRLYNRQL